MTVDNALRAKSAPSDYSALSKRVAGAGLLARRPGYYVARMGGLAALFLGGWTAFAFLGDSWWTLLLAGFMAFMYGQVALVAHDLAHRQVFRTRKPSERAGWIAGNLCIGMSYGWWMDKHTRHHANPNHEELDPDVDPDILVWSKEQAEASKGVPRFIGRWQAFLFFPLLTLEGLNLHVSGFRALNKPAIKHRAIEATLLVTHCVVYLGALFVVLSPGKAVLFLVIHQALWGVYMGSIFAPGHKGMPTMKPGEKVDFLRRQVLTSRNVRGGWLIDTVMGGLNYQIEHHLFPSMPTPHLRRAQEIVREYCSELKIPYHERGLIGSWNEALTHLHQVGAPLRRAS